MNTVKKILIVHPGPRIRRTLVMLLAGAGHDTRACADLDSALQTATAEWFDLAMIDAPGSGAGLNIAAALRKIQPTVPVLLLAPKLELPQVIQAIRMGVSDVVAQTDDWRPVLQHVRELLRLENPEPAEDAPTAGELAAAEAAITQAGGTVGVRASANPFDLTTEELRRQMVQLVREREEFDSHLERAAREKSALEAELKALLAQTAADQRIQAERDDLRTQRELAATAQATIDEKARGLAEAQAELERERAAHVAARSPQPAPTATDERQTLEAWRAELRTEDARLREEGLRVRQDAAQLAHERRRWNDDLELLRDQENNLRAYEERLRGRLAEAEAARVSSHAAGAAAIGPDAGLTEAWAKIQRATELIEAERRGFCEDRLLFKEQSAELKHREDMISAGEARLIEWERRLSASTLAPPTRSPLDRARSIWGGGKK